MSLLTVMVVTHELEVQQALASALAPCKLAPIIAPSIQEATAILSGHAISLIFCSDKLPSEGVDMLIRHTWRPRNRVPVVVVSRLDSWERYLNSLHSGAYDYVLYPLSRGEIERVMNNLRDLQNLSMFRHSAQIGPSKTTQTTPFTTRLTLRM
jgi:DNA-binding response OmpR family regulator